MNANKENAFKNPAEPDGFLAEAKKPRVRMSNFWGNSISYRFLNAIRENAFRNPAEPDDFLAGAKKPQVRMSNFWGNSISYGMLNFSGNPIFGYVFLGYSKKYARVTAVYK